jgi:hypothetical protein
VDWKRLGGGSVMGSFEHGTEPSGSIKMEAVSSRP